MEPYQISYLLIIVALLIPIGLFIYWAIWIAEGLYFGKEAVRRLYDLGAKSYDGVKEYDDLHEATFLGNPFFSRLEEDFGVTSLTLDVATGTGRLPLALLKIPFYEGTVIGVDYSREMLREAARKCAEYNGRVTFIHHPAVPLPFTRPSCRPARNDTGASPRRLVHYQQSHRGRSKMVAGAYRHPRSL
jgi:SAM-dependent methyltransferase